jgi:hypothetical protein
MSDVTLAEIVDLTAAEFGVTLAEMRANHSGANRGQRFLERPAGLSARRVAAYLAHRHTALQWRKIAAMLSGSLSDARFRMREDAEMVAFLLGCDKDLAAVVERIEAQIDEIHESRVARGDSHSGEPAATRGQQRGDTRATERATP